MRHCLFTIFQTKEKSKIHFWLQSNNQRTNGDKFSDVSSIVCAVHQWKFPEIQSVDVHKYFHIDGIFIDVNLAAKSANKHTITILLKSFLFNLIAYCIALHRIASKYRNGCVHLQHLCHPSFIYWETITLNDLFTALSVSKPTISIWKTVGACCEIEMNTSNEPTNQTTNTH